MKASCDKRKSEPEHNYFVADCDRKTPNGEGERGKNRNDGHKHSEPEKCGEANVTLSLTCMIYCPNVRDTVLHNVDRYRIKLVQRPYCNGKLANSNFNEDRILELILCSRHFRTSCISFLGVGT